MAKLRISAKIRNTKGFKYLEQCFGSGYLRQIDKFISVPRGDSTYLANSFYPDRIMVVPDADLLSVLDIFRKPIPFLLFLSELQAVFKLNYHNPDKRMLDRITSLLDFTVLLFKDKFIVYESFDEYKQLKKFRNQALYFQSPSAIYIMTSLDCNFACPHCFIYNRAAQESKPSKRRLTPKVFDEQIAFATKFFPKHKGFTVSVFYYGGEPLLNKGLIAYSAKKIRSLQKKGAFGEADVILQIITNGSLIDEDTVALFKKYSIFPGISLDGVAEANDKHRIFKDGTGTFGSILKGIDVLRKNDCHFGISLTIGPENIDTTVNDLEWIAENLGRPSVFFNFMRGGKEKDPFDGLSKDELFAKLHAIYDKLRDLQLIEGRLDRYTRKIHRGLAPYQFYCSAVGGGQFVFRPDGKVGLCHAGLMTDEKQFQLPKDIGDIKKDPVWLEWLARTPVFIKECYRHCNYFALCPGGCAYRDWEITGDLFSVAEETCTIERFLIERGIIEIVETGRLS